MRRVPLWWDQGTLDDIVAWKKERQSQGAKPADFFVCALSKAASGNQLDPRNLRNRFISSCRTLGKERQKHLTIHHGRHSFISHSLAGGRSLPEVRDAVGHSNISITSVYAHIVNEDEGNGNLFDFEGDAEQ
jgi:site-specific recombinase XerC